MPSSKEFLNRVMTGFSLVDNVSSSPHESDYRLYVDDRALGGVFDDRLLLKPVPSVIGMLPRSFYYRPYSGSRPMLEIEDVDDQQLLKTIVEVMYPQLSVPRKKH